MKVNKSTGSFSRNGSLRSRRYTTSAANASYSSLPSPLPPRSPNYQCTVAPPEEGQLRHKKSPSSPNCYAKALPRSPVPSSPSYPNSPSVQSERSFNKSPSSQHSSDHRIFDFPTTSSMEYATQKSPIMTPKSPRSPRAVRYDSSDSPTSPSVHSSMNSNYFNFNLQSPPKKQQQPSSSKAYHTRQQYQSTKTDSSNSTKSSLEYASTKKHPTGDYQDIEYKVCNNSMDSDSQPSSSVDFPTCIGYRHNTQRRNARHPSTASLKEKINVASNSNSNSNNSPKPTRSGGGNSRSNSGKKPKCNIRTNPGYDERYASSKSINECKRSSKKAQKNMEICRKSTSDLTDLTDEAANTTMTSLSRPSSPRRKGSVKGGLAYLASRRGSRDSIASNMSNISNEDIGPLNFQNTARGRQRRTSNFLELPVPDHIRPRVCSLPEKAYNPRLSDDLYRLRTFSITNKGGVVNCGDSIINRRSKSNTSVNSTASRASNVSGERSPFEGSCCGSGYHTVDSTPLGSPEEFEVPKYRVVMLGDSGVGKTALVSQFMTSEYMNTYDASLDDEFGERTVSILLDGEESEMIFIDHPSAEMSVENSLSTYEPHACVVVYSIVARSSFHHAEDTLNYLWREGYTKEKSVIVVGNKADLARSRVISTNDGKALAVSRECKFIETSSGIQHNVDELLVGILKQIRLRDARDKKKAATGSKKEHHNKLHGSKTSLSLNIAREILQKICLNDISKSKSCENLHVL